MRTMKVANYKNIDTESYHIGDVMGLWSIARNKIIGLSTLAVIYRQAEDFELKLMLKAGADLVIGRQINKIQKLLNDKGFDVPTEPEWEKKFKEDSSFEISSKIIDDEEIVLSMKEGFRLTLTLEAEALRNATDPDVRKLLKKIMDEDNLGFATLLQLQKTKGWSDFAPLLMPQDKEEDYGPNEYHPQ